MMSDDRKKVTVYTAIVSVEIELVIDEAVFDAVDDNFRSKFYNLSTREEVVKHIAYNAVNRKWAFSVTSLDGWADQEKFAVGINDIDKWVEIQ